MDTRIGRMQARKLVYTADDFTQMGDIHCERFLKYNPEMKAQLEVGKGMLLDAIKHYTPSDTKRTVDLVAQHEQAEIHQSSGRSMKL